MRGALITSSIVVLLVAVLMLLIYVARIHGAIDYCLDHDLEWDCKEFDKK